MADVCLRFIHGTGTQVPVLWAKAEQVPRVPRYKKYTQNKTTGTANFLSLHLGSQRTSTLHSHAPNVLLHCTSVWTGALLIWLVTQSLAFLFSVILLTCGALLKTQDYIGHNNTYQYAYGPVKSLNDMMWFTALWCLVVMSLERSMTVAQNRVRSVCTCLQACVVSEPIVVIFDWYIFMSFMAHFLTSLNINLFIFGYLRKLRLKVVHKALFVLNCVKNGQLVIGDFLSLGT